MAYNPYASPGYPANYIPSGTADIAGVTWVSSYQEALSAIVPYGKQLFMERNQNVFYVKDNTGAIKAFKFEEMPMPSNDPSNFVTKKEFDELKAKYEQLIQQQPVQTSGYITTIESASTDGTTQELQWESTAGTAGVLQQSGTDGINGVTAQQPA